MSEQNIPKPENWREQGPSQEELTGRYWFRLDRQNSLIFFGVLAGIFGLAMLQFDKIEAFPFWLMIFFFAMMIWLRSVWALTCVFVVLFTIKFFTDVELVDAASASTIPKNIFLDEFGVREAVRYGFVPKLRPTDWAFTFFALMFMGTSLRFLEIHKYNLGYFSEFGIGEGKFIEDRRRFPSLLGGRWWGIVLSIIIAVCLLFLFPLDLQTVSKYWIRPRAMRVIFLLGALFLVWFLVRGFIQLVMRWTMDRDQANVLVRSIYATEFWREHRGIESRLEKINRKQKMALHQSEIYDVD